jgi:hypothetical protein
MVIGKILVADQHRQIVGQRQLDLFAVAGRPAIFAQRRNAVSNYAWIAGAGSGIATSDALSGIAPIKRSAPFL